MKILSIVLAVLLMALPALADDGIFVSYQSSIFMPEDDNFGYGKGFYGQGVEIGYSWKYAEIGCEWYQSSLKTLHASTFNNNSVMGTLKAKYPMFKWTPYAVIGMGEHIFTNEKMKIDPEQPAEVWNVPESIKNKSCIALKYGAGIQYELTKHISLFGEAVYRYGDTGEPSSIDIYAWSYSGGVRVKF